MGIEPEAFMTAINQRYFFGKHLPPRNEKVNKNH